MAPFFCCPSVSSVEETWSDGMESRAGADFGMLAAARSPLPDPVSGASSAAESPPSGGLRGGREDRTSSGFDSDTSARHRP
ncbi:hypothetical protein OG754_10495 [Streptomyces decoyicus]|uniref:hypothetical protein n=1 Tax=Streptomyces decoyicus TaxID=249567 RepID=UPI002E300C8C|nr:hypothetical protein [Streptomyces decoyicus]